MENNQTQFLTDLSALLNKYDVDIEFAADDPYINGEIEILFKATNETINTNLWELTASNLEMFRDELKKEKE